MLLTPADFQTIPAGTETDARIAEMMGYRAWKEQRGAYTLCVQAALSERPPWDRAPRPDPERYTQVSCVEAARLGFFADGFPRFSADWNAMGQLSEWLRLGRWFPTLHATPTGYDAQIACWGADELLRDVTARAETAPLAICRAALLADALEGK